MNVNSQQHGEAHGDIEMIHAVEMLCIAFRGRIEQWCRFRTVLTDIIIERRVPSETELFELRGLWKPDA